MTDGREAMDAALRDRLLPHLRRLGFKGSLPHLHRFRDGAADLLSVQFRSSGGAFVVELGRIAADGFDFHGRHIPPAKARTSYLFPRFCHRLGTPLDRPGDHWFEFTDRHPAAVADEVAVLLDDPALWRLIDGWPVLGRDDPALFRYP